MSEVSSSTHSLSKRICISYCDSDYIAIVGCTAILTGMLALFYHYNVIAELSNPIAREFKNLTWGEGGLMAIPLPVTLWTVGKAAHLYLEVPVQPPVQTEANGPTPSPKPPRPPPSSPASVIIEDEGTPKTFKRKDSAEGPPLPPSRVVTYRPQPIEPQFYTLRHFQEDFHQGVAHFIAQLQGKNPDPLPPRDQRLMIDMSNLVTDQQIANPHGDCFLIALLFKIGEERKGVSLNPAEIAAINNDVNTINSLRAAFAQVDLEKWNLHKERLHAINDLLAQRNPYRSQLYYYCYENYTKKYSKDRPLNNPDYDADLKQCPEIEKFVQDIVEQLEELRAIRLTGVVLTPEQVALVQSYCYYAGEIKKGTFLSPEIYAQIEEIEQSAGYDQEWVLQLRKGVSNYYQAVGDRHLSFYVGHFKPLYRGLFDAVNSSLKEPLVKQSFYDEYDPKLSIQEYQNHLTSLQRQCPRASFEPLEPLFGVAMQEGSALKDVRALTFQPEEIVEATVPLPLIEARQFLELAFNEATVANRQGGQVLFLGDLARVALHERTDVTLITFTQPNDRPTFEYAVTIPRSQDFNSDRVWSIIHKVDDPHYNGYDNRSGLELFGTLFPPHNKLPEDPQLAFATLQLADKANAMLAEKLRKRYEQP